ncbi:hypothetical protein GGI07_005678 [Coemansia sp. Benny D115]|nr:hypothetical protein GGI07_005678 [Coemansia sp. Benny D115]
MFGNRIYLISKSQVRYVGTLNDVNEAEQTISLGQVYSMGTEGRRGNPMEEIPPSKVMYDLIQFRATDVLSVQFESEVPPPPEPAIPNDPAILEARPNIAGQSQGQAVPPPPPVQHQHQQAPSYGGAAPAAAPGYASAVPEMTPAVAAPAAPAAPRQQEPAEEVVTDTDSVADGNERQQGGYQRRQSGYNNTSRGGYSARGGRGGYNNQGNRRGGYQGRGGYQNRQGRRVEVPDSDFDFESSNSKLNKDDLAKEFAKLKVKVAEDQSEGTFASSSRGGVASSDAATGSSASATPSGAAEAGAQSAAVPSSSYVPKKSFFDDISCEAKERMQLQEHGLSYEEKRSRINAERQQNLETFGQLSSDQSRFRYNRYNSGGRGGGANGSGYFNGSGHANGGNNNNNNGSGSSGYRGGRGGSRGGYYRGGQNNGGYRGGYRSQYNNNAGAGNNAGGQYSQQQQNAETGA